MKIALTIILAAWTLAAGAQPYVAAGLVDLEPELSVGYRLKQLEFEVANYGTHELGRIRTLQAAETWTVERGMRATVRYAISLTPSTSVGVGLGTHRARYVHTGEANGKHWTLGLTLGARFALDAISRHAALRVEWMVADAPKGFEQFEGLRSAFEWTFR